MFRRLVMILRAKFNKGLRKAEDPRELMDLSYEDQQNLLYNVRRSIADLATSKKQLELKRDSVVKSIATLEEQATQAVKMERDDLAEQALQRKVMLEETRDGLNTSITELTERTNLASSQAAALEAKIEKFKIDKEVFGARYTAAEATVKIGEAFTGIGDGMQNIGQIAARANEALEQEEARGLAIGELVENGTLRDMTAIDAPDKLTKELASLTSGDKVKEELAALKAAHAPAIEAPKTTRKPRAKKAEVTAQ